MTTTFIDNYNNKHEISEYPQFPDYQIIVNNTHTFLVELCQLDLTGQKDTSFNVFHVIEKNKRTEAICQLVQTSTSCIIKTPGYNPHFFFSAYTIIEAFAEFFNSYMKEYK